MGYVQKKNHGKVLAKFEKQQEKKKDDKEQTHKSVKKCEVKQWQSWV